MEEMANVVVVVWQGPGWYGSLMLDDGSIRYEMYDDALDSWPEPTFSWKTRLYGDVWLNDLEDIRFLIHARKLVTIINKNN